jgi:GT2 family glycosyltransferase
VQMTRHRARLRPRGEPRLRTSFGWFHERMLSGFATDPSDPTRKFVVELFLDGLPIRIARADEYVHELAQEGVGDGCYGFSFPLRDDLLAEGVVAEARIANIGTPIGAPITFANRAGAGKSNDGSGSVRWLGGLRFSGWLGEDARERTLDVLVDGELVAQTEFSGWSNVGADPQTARAARAFAVHLPEKFADGQARQLAVVKANGDSLPGSPVAFVAFAGGLAETLARLDALEPERLRAEAFDRLIPMSVPFSQYQAWRERFPPPRLTPPPHAPLQQAAVVMVGSGDMDDTVASLQAQTRDQWVAALLPQTAGPLGFDPKLALTYLDRDAAGCDFVVFGPAGTILVPTALERIAAAFAQFDKACAVYGDVDVTGTDHSAWPLALPAFDYERMLEQGYCAYFFALRLAVARQALAAGACDLYRLFNAILDRETDWADRIVHVPGALAALPEIDVASVQPVLAAATRAHLDARGAAARVTSARGGLLPAVRSSPIIDSVNISIIIPTRNRRKLLADCIESIKPAVENRAAEIIVVDNDSTDEDTLDYLAAIDGTVARVLRVPGDFNFARLNNLAAAAATGDCLCLLNNDIKALDGNWLDEMLARLASPNVGAVGALLVWPSGVVQHGGVVLGPRFAAAHAFNDRVATDAGYADQLCVAHECSAVTAACLVTRRADFLSVEGMDELRFPVNFNDVDYCLKLRAAGKRIVFTPHARLLHLESASRGCDDTADRRARFERELTNLRTKWGAVLVDDSFYNPTLSLDPYPFSALAWPPRDMSPRVVTQPKPVIAPPGI